MTVTISPSAAVETGAQWRRLGTTIWRNSGVSGTENGISAGSYTVEFKPILGWTEPPNHNVTITTGQLTSISETYVQNGGGTSSFTIYNDGTKQLSITSINPEQSAPWISWTPPAPFAVEPYNPVLVTVSIDYSQAPAGQTTRRLLVTSNDTDESPYPGGVNIVVNKGEDQPELIVSPSDNLVASGYEGGGFSPLTKTYEISNTGKGTLNWTANCPSNWISLSKTSGTAPDSVTVSINDNANYFPGSVAGTHYDTTINIGSNGGTTTRQVDLTVFNLDGEGEAEGQIEDEGAFEGGGGIEGQIEGEGESALTWTRSLSNAFDAAQSQSKLVLLLVGRNTCMNTLYMRDTVCELSNPPIKTYIQEHYVPWFANVDSDTDWYSFGNGLDSYVLPIICRINPNDPSHYLDRTTGIQDAVTFYARLQQDGEGEEEGILEGQPESDGEIEGVSDEEGEDSTEGTAEGEPEGQIPLSISQQPQDAAVYVGMQHIFYVGIQGGIGSITYLWKKDGMELAVSSSPTCTITSAILSDEGVYTCTVSDELTSLDSDDAILTVFERPLAGQHTADQDGNWTVNLSELLRIIQFFNSGGYYCQAGSEDGYAPGFGDHSCTPHDSDYNVQDWFINLSELLRLIQFFNSGGYHCETGTEDGYAPGPGPLCETEGEGIMEGVVEGIEEGDVEGLPAEGSPEEGEGVEEGFIEGQQEGIEEGAAEGVIEGPLEGQIEGETEGTVDGEGAVEEGYAEGQIEGILEGYAEGINEGVIEGIFEGQVEGQIEGEGMSEGENEGESIPNLYNTGVDNSESVLSDNEVDPHWTLKVSADPDWSGPNLYASSVFPPTWLPNDSTSRWISPRSPESDVVPGTYTLRTTFDLICFNPDSAVITGRFSCDNEVTDILINDAPTSQNAVGFTEWHEFTIHNGFHEGVNTLDFIVDNSGDPRNPSGLRVELSGWAVRAEQAEVVPIMIDVPAGAFDMGRINDGDDQLFGNDAEILHSVSLNSYRIGMFEVTNQQYAYVLNWALAQGYLENSTHNPYSGGSVYYLGHMLIDTESPYCQISFPCETFVTEIRENEFSMSEHPVVCVTWFGAVAFCNWLSTIHGLSQCYYLTESDWVLDNRDAGGYRLPTEAEWERAAAWDGSKHWIYGYTSDTLIDSAHCNANEPEWINPLGLIAEPKTSPIGWFDGVNPSTVNSISPLGCYDMSGNAWEWCHDWYDSNYYNISPSSNPLGPETGSVRALRGGSWNSNKGNCRTARRNSAAPATADKEYGFRIVQSGSK